MFSGMTLGFGSKMKVGKKTEQRVSCDKVSSTVGSGRSANIEPSHKCPECSKTFATSGKLLQHMFVHNDEKPFRCSNCEKSFSSKFKLMRHSLIHSSERQYRCTYCERCFHRKDHLKNHLQVHNPNKKVYKCEECCKEYNSRLSYRKHIAIHAAEAGDLNCKICGQNFQTSEEILYHLKVHAGSRTVKNPNEKKFECEHCERRFFTRKDVKRHLVVHTGRRDFLCQFCPQRFGRKDHLVRHIKKSHNSNVNVQPVVLSSACPIANFTKSLIAANLCPNIDGSTSCHFSEKIVPTKLDSSTNVPLEFPQSFLPNDIKNFGDFKVERNDCAIIDVPNTTFDISQLLNYSSSSLGTMPLLNSVSLPVAINSPPTLTSTPMVNVLPRFSQAFQ